MSINWSSYTFGAVSSKEFTRRDEKPCNEFDEDGLGLLGDGLGPPVLLVVGLAALGVGLVEHVGLPLPAHVTAAIAPGPAGTAPPLLLEGGAAPSSAASRAADGGPPLGVAAATSRRGCSAGSGRRRPAPAGTSAAAPHDGKESSDYNTEGDQLHRLLSPERERQKTNLGHDLSVWLGNRIGPLHVGNEGIASILTRERVHHEPQVPDGTSRLKQRHQLIFI
ncbi:hypothetical protein EYF80_029803 [Liparis tanakae]|uniref:Uncharacterized protein n=1 Tax=Liparis tanakae TaxID=230148 RepID=A0A4Z2H2Z1_9TELE|nr:hypothetical protein EYF80_029803 [Liparis tanakae]